jgi:hypothetical protein
MKDQYLKKSGTTSNSKLLKIKYFQQDLVFIYLYN